MLLTFAMTCHDIADAAWNPEEQSLTDISFFKTDLPKQSGHVTELVVTEI